MTPTALLIRRGRLNRKLIVVPHARIQSVSCYQGPLQRALRVAKFTIDTTPGPVLPIVPHQDVSTVAALEIGRASCRERGEIWGEDESGEERSRGVEDRVYGWTCD